MNVRNTYVYLTYILEMLLIILHSQDPLGDLTVQSLKMFWAHYRVNTW